MLRSRLWVCSATAALLLMTACSAGGGTDAANDAGGKELATVKVGMLPTMIAPVWSAEGQGLFEEHGLHVKYVGFQSGPAQTAALQSGVIDIAWGAATTWYSIAAGGAPAQWLVTAGQYNVADRMVVCDDSIRSVDDLRGKKIGLPFNTVVHGPLLLMLKKHDIPKQSVHLVNLEPAKAIAGLLNGSLDAAYVWPPHTSQALDRGCRTLFRSADTPGGGWSWDGFAVNSQWVKKGNNAQLAAQWLKAVEQGRKTMDKHFKVTVQAAVDHGSLPRKVAISEYKVLKFPPLKDNVTPNTPLSMCGADDNTGLGVTLTQAKTFYQDIGVINEPLPLDQYLNPKPLNMAFGTHCKA